MIRYEPGSPNLPQVMPCPDCLDKDGKPINTVHRRTPSGLWICWCGAVAKQQADVDASLKGSE